MEKIYVIICSHIKPRFKRSKTILSENLRRNIMININIYIEDNEQFDELKRGNSFEGLIATVDNGITQYEYESSYEEIEMYTNEKNNSGEWETVDHDYNVGILNECETLEEFAMLLVKHFM
jgi:hypothetical protein